MKHAWISAEILGGARCIKCRLSGSLWQGIAFRLPETSRSLGTPHFFIQILIFFYKLLHFFVACFVRENGPPPNQPQQQHRRSSSDRPGYINLSSRGPTAAVAATYSTSSISTHVNRISVGFGSAPPWAVPAPDLDMGTWPWVQTGVNRSALSCHAGGRSSRQERKLLRAWLTRCVYISVTNRALGGEVWSQGETDEDIYQGEADEHI